MPLTLAPTADRLRRRRQARVDRMAERLLERVTTLADEDRRRIARDRVVLHLVVAPVHLLTLALTAGSAWWLVTGTGPERFLGVFGLALAFVLRPRLGHFDEASTRVPRADAPSLHGVLDAVAEVVGAPPPDVVVVSGRVNASVGRVGLRRHRVLELGAPLWTALPHQGRLAVLGHEMGHVAYGDLRSGFWVGSAYETLVAWFTTLTPDSDRGDLVLFGLVTAPARWVVEAYLLLVDHLDARSSRRQEYLADLASADVGGTAGALVAFDVMLSSDTIDLALRRSARTLQRPSDADAGLWDAIRSAIAARPAHPEGRRRHGELERLRADDSHPRTTLRIALLERRRPVHPRVVVTDDDWERIAKELEPAMTAQARRAAYRLSYVH